MTYNLHFNFSEKENVTIVAECDDYLLTLFGMQVNMDNDIYFKRSKIENIEMLPKYSNGHGSWNSFLPPTFDMIKHLNNECVESIDIKYILSNTNKSKQSFKVLQVLTH